MPTSIVSLVVETGCTIVGGLDTFGKMNAEFSRSCTSWRAWYRSVPGAKCSSMSDSPGIESEVMSVVPRMPDKRFFSSGTVTSSSTSGADRPSASICTSTVTGDVSGRVSVAIRGSVRMPATIIPAATAITRMRKRVKASITVRTYRPLSSTKQSVMPRLKNLVTFFPLGLLGPVNSPRGGNAPLDTLDTLGSRKICPVCPVRPERNRIGRQYPCPCRTRPELGI